jgi:hypothetical protein
MLDETMPSREFLETTLATALEAYPHDELMMAWKDLNDLIKLAHSDRRFSAAEFGLVVWVRNLIEDGVYADY